MFPI